MAAALTTTTAITISLLFTKSRFIMSGTAPAPSTAPAKIFPGSSDHSTSTNPPEAAELTRTASSGYSSKPLPSAPTSAPSSIFYEEGWAIADTSSVSAILFVPAFFFFLSLRLACHIKLACQPGNGGPHAETADIMTDHIKTHPCPDRRNWEVRGGCVGSGI